MFVVSIRPRKSLRKGEGADILESADLKLLLTPEKMRALPPLYSIFKKDKKSTNKNIAR